MDERMLNGFENSSPSGLRREKSPASDLRSVQCYRGGRYAATRTRSRNGLEGHRPITGDHSVAVDVVFHHAPASRASNSLDRPGSLYCLTSAYRMGRRRPM
jgi:hypothetical protein